MPPPGVVSASLVLRTAVRRWLCFHQLAKKGGKDELCLGRWAGAVAKRSVWVNAARGRHEAKRWGAGVRQWGPFRDCHVVSVAGEKGAGGSVCEPLEKNMGCVVRALYTNQQA